MLREVIQLGSCRIDKFTFRSVSKGVVVCSEHIELNFEEIKAMADKLMYADKDEYYRRTGKDRRRV